MSVLSLHRIRPPTARGALAAAALTLGLLLTFGGAGHSLAVAAGALQSHRPYDFRLAALFVNGGVLLYVGLSNMVLSRWIAQGQTWALAWSAIVSTALAVYCALLFPVPSARDNVGPALVLVCGYLLSLGLLARRAVRPSTPATAA